MTCAEMLGMIGWSADPDTRVEGRTRKGRLCLRRPGHACRRRLLLLSCEGIRKSLGCLEVDGDYDRTNGIALDEVDSPFTTRKSRDSPSGSSIVKVSPGSGTKDSVILNVYSLSPEVSCSSMLMNDLPLA